MIIEDHGRFKGKYRNLRDVCALFTDVAQLLIHGNSMCSYAKILFHDNQVQSDGKNEL